MDRIFLSRERLDGGRFVVNGSERRHLASSLRVRAGDRFLATDGEGREYLLEVEKVARPELVAGVIEERRVPPGPGASITLAVAPPKGTRMETAIEKATECGVGRIVPLQTTRSVVKSRDDSDRAERWRRVARSATAQSGRCHVPDIAGVATLASVLQGGGRLLIAHGGPEAVPISAALRGVTSTDPLTILVGPEGGFSDEELEEARRAGATAVSLGSFRLRTETAAIVAAALAITVLESRT